MEKDTTFRKLFLEATRLLAWPTPRVYSVLHFMKPLLGEPFSELDRPLQIGKKRREIEEQLTKLHAAKIKELERYMKPYKRELKTERRWERGTAAAHALSITWWQHDPKENRLKINKQDSKKTHGWLLIVGDRSSVNRIGRQEWRLRVRFAVITGEKYDKSTGTDAVNGYLNHLGNEIKSLYLVTGNDSRPTATLEAEALRSIMPEAVKIETDLPTESVGHFNLQPSFPNRRSVENYLAVFLTHNNRFPDKNSDWWRHLHMKAADDTAIAKLFGGAMPFLCDKNGVRWGME